MKKDNRFIIIKDKIDPMILWLSRSESLTIHKGDRLEDVAQIVKKRWKLSLVDARQLVAYWFALGERARSKKLGQKWRGQELHSSPTRRYLKRID